MSGGEIYTVLRFTCITFLLYFTGHPTLSADSGGGEAVSGAGGGLWVWVTSTPGHANRKLGEKDGPHCNNIIRALKHQNIQENNIYAIIVTSYALIVNWYIKTPN